MGDGTNGVVEVADDVFLGRGTDVNWFLVRDGADVTLIDGGYPRDFERLVASVRTIGSRPEQVVGILLTHAHVDHAGGVAAFAARYGIPVYTGEREARHARREFKEQAGPVDVLKNVRRPGMLPWLSHVLRAGALADVAVPSAQAFDRTLDLPGRPVPVDTAGHTSGHTAYLLPDARAVATGDALVTGHALLPGTSPSVLPTFFAHGDPLPALDRLAELDADLILPGHGEPLRMPIRAAAASARDRAAPQT